ncbi:NUDIX domain [Candidatus Rhabdochlamydia oedothoracis]|uniref:Bis(5'-nucleosyl)-tetraphosphatase [asymmetrical] n=1 Tax=Candidatus Rhabdochlamydia oedothoracis TaxID=2720720 RepID=A0ABX8V3P2_9BACT|nr:MULTISPECIES: NUDIX domain-containing protein [Rhabdochlamydia]KAG6559459.1 Diadenosine hexaphosphate hydrolase [Candidatus Rhabdochlamydia sp. W815]MCL6756228.1 NUDIX domain-containing protein [Candidatus Rhabdochlamydia oedothoracis]QYF49117.1 NUDIX domain [Candidatus Rhabdochlamydia oedothoracis]
MITSYGIIPFRKLKGKWQVLLIQHLNGQHWGFPKGRAEKTETAQKTAIRELKEETGLRVRQLLSLKPFTESYSLQEKSKIVGYFPALVTGVLECQPNEIVQARWFDLDEAMKQISFPESQNVFKQARKYLDGYIT